MLKCEKKLYNVIFSTEIKTKFVLNVKQLLNKNSEKEKTEIKNLKTRELKEKKKTLFELLKKYIIYT